MPPLLCDEWISVELWWLKYIISRTLLGFANVVHFLLKIEIKNWIQKWFQHQQIDESKESDQHQDQERINCLELSFLEYPHIGQPYLHFDIVHWAPLPFLKEWSQPWASHPGAFHPLSTLPSHRPLPQNWLLIISSMMVSGWDLFDRTGMVLRF